MSQSRTQEKKPDGYPGILWETGDGCGRYLDARGLKKGYLLSFCDNRETPHEDRTFQYCGHEICEVIVAYRDV